MVCSVCKRPGKGKRCIFDGNELVPATGNASVPTSQSPSVQPVQQVNNTSSGDKIKFTSQVHGIMIEVRDGDIIGSKNGAFANVFNRFKFISSTHCRIVKTAAGWHIQDIGSNNTGSTNGTFINGTKLNPNTLYPFTSGTTVTIADVELFITYDTIGGGTSRL